MATALATLLTEVENAIATLLTTGTGIQSYTIQTPGGGSRTVTRSNLGELRLWRREIKSEIDSENSRSDGGPLNYGRRGRA